MFGLNAVTLEECELGLPGHEGVGVRPKHPLPAVEGDAGRGLPLRLEVSDDLYER